MGKKAVISPCLKKLFPTKNPRSRENLADSNWIHKKVGGNYHHITVSNKEGGS